MYNFRFKCQYLTEPAYKQTWTNGSITIIISELIKEKCVVVKIAENTKVEMLRSGIQQVLLDDNKEEKKV